MEREQETIEAHVGVEFRISRPSSPTTGYHWEAHYDEQAVSLRGDDYRRTSGLIGGGGVQTFTFVPLRAGKTSICLRYRRPWEDGVVEEAEYPVLVSY